MVAWFTWGGGGWCEGREERRFCKFHFLPLKLQGSYCVSLLTVSDHHFANIQWLSSTVVFCLKVDVALKMWGAVFSSFRLLKVLRGWWLWKATCSMHGSESRPPESLSSSKKWARWTSHSSSKTQFSYCLSHFMQAKCRSLISGVLGLILKIRKMYCYNKHISSVIYTLHPWC